MRRKRSLDASKNRITGCHRRAGEDASSKLTWVDVVWLGVGHQVFDRGVLALIFREEFGVNIWILKSKIGIVPQTT